MKRESTSPFAGVLYAKKKEMLTSFRDYAKYLMILFVALHVDNKTKYTHNKNSIWALYSYVRLSCTSYKSQL